MSELFQAVNKLLGEVGVFFRYFAAGFSMVAAIIVATGKFEQITCWQTKLGSWWAVGLIVLIAGFSAYTISRIFFINIAIFFCRYIAMLVSQILPATELELAAARWRRRGMSDAVKSVNAQPIGTVLAAAQKQLDNWNHMLHFVFSSAVVGFIVWGYYKWVDPAGANAGGEKALFRICAFVLFISCVDLFREARREFWLYRIQTGHKLKITWGL